MIKGITIILYEKTKTGVNRIGEDVYTETPVEVGNVLVAPSEGTQTQGTPLALDLTGRKAIYTLAIPKGDTHNWINSTVEFFGRKFRTVGEPTEGIDLLIPLSWNKKVKVETFGECEDNTE